MQRVLLILLFCMCSTTVFAQTSVTVDISGVSQPLVDNIRLFLSIEQQKDNALLSEGRLRRLHKKALAEITSALQPFGYYRPVVASSLMMVSPERWKASYQVDPGPALRIAQLNISISEPMRSDPEFETLLSKLPLHTGDVFDHLLYEKIKSSLARLAAERGYFNAQFVEHRVEIDLDAYEARVFLKYEGAVRYRFGEVSLQQDVLDEDLLRRYIPFETGSPYTLGELIDFQQALNDSDYFRTVEVSPGQALADSDEIPVNVSLTPRKRHRFSIGLGYGTDSGARTKFGWQIPRVNTKGHRFDTEIKLSQIGYSLSANYRVPVLNPRTDQMIYSAGVINEKTDTSDSTVRTVGASLKRSRGEWRESISLNYQQEDYIIADTSGDSTLLMPGVSWSRTWGDSFIYAIDGLRFDISLRGANDKYVSDTSFFQAQGGIKAINTPIRNNRIIARGSIGSTWTNNFDQLPSSVRFFTGGSQSVRGYAYQITRPGR